MKLLSKLFSTFVFFSLAAQAAEVPLKTCELGVYTYDSIVAVGGLGPELFSRFEKESGCKIKVLASGDGVQLLSHLEIDEKRGKPQGQIVLGIDQALWGRALPFVETIQDWNSPELQHLNKEISRGALAQGFVPYDYGILSLMVDQQNLSAAKFPRSIKDLLKSEWKKKFILEDPRTSSPGLQFVLMTDHLLKTEFKNYWISMKYQWLAMPEGWSAAYGLFLKGEASLVWSYTTSQAYHEEHGSVRYKAVLFDEGQPVQIESAMLVKGAFKSNAQKKIAERFLSFLISEKIQAIIPKTNWMFPIRDGISLPESFKKLPLPRHLLFFNPDSDRKSDVILTEWERALLE